MGLPKACFAIAAVDGLTGFSEAIHSVFPKTRDQRGIIHRIRYALKYVTWRDRKAFVADLETVYKAATLEEAEADLVWLEKARG